MCSGPRSERAWTSSPGRRVSASRQSTPTECPLLALAAHSEAAATQESRYAERQLCTGPVRGAGDSLRAGSAGLRTRLGLKCRHNMIRDRRCEPADFLSVFGGSVRTSASSSPARTARSTATHSLSSPIIILSVLASGDSARWPAKGSRARHIARSEHTPLDGLAARNVRSPGRSAERQFRVPCRGSSVLYLSPGPASAPEALTGIEVHDPKDLTQGYKPFLSSNKRDEWVGVANTEPSGHWEADPDVSASGQPQPDLVAIKATEHCDLLLIGCS